MATIRSTPPAGDGATIIGESVLVRGTLSGDEDLHVLGRVDGRVELQRTLVVAQSGILKAEISVKNAIVSGVIAERKPTRPKLTPITGTGASRNWCRARSISPTPGRITPPLNSPAAVR